MNRTAASEYHSYSSTGHGPRGSAIGIVRR